MLSRMLSRQLRQTYLCRCIKGFAQFGSLLLSMGRGLSL